MNTLKLGTDLQTSIKKLILDTYYPVGSIYITETTLNPNNQFGGTWEQIAGGKYLFGIGGSDGNVSPGTTGGSWSHEHSTANHTLTISEIPSHSHLIGKQKTGIAGSSGDNTAAIWWDSNSGIASTSVGGGKAHNHGNTGSTKVVPPYYAVYIWKRTA